MPDAAEQLHQLLLRHVVEHELQIVAVAAAAAAAASAAAGRQAVDRRRIVHHFVDAAGPLLVLVRLRLLHPEEQASRRRLELQQIHAPRLALLDLLELAVVREDDQVVLDFVCGAILPAEVDEAVLGLVDVQQPLAGVRVDHLADHGHSAGAELDQVAVSTRRAGQIHVIPCATHFELDPSRLSPLGSLPFHLPKIGPDILIFCRLDLSVIQ